MFKTSLCKAVWLVRDPSTAGGQVCEGWNQGLPGTAQPAKAACGLEMPPLPGQMLLSPGLTSLSCGHLLENNHLWVNL